MRAENTVLELFLLLGFLIPALVFFVQPAMAQYNYDHVNVTTRVNVTSAAPEVQLVSVDSVQGNITLNAGGIRSVNCNATLRDFNGFNDIVAVNATFYHFYNLSTQQDDENDHYTNGSCVQVANDGLYTVNYTCNFQVFYFATNGTWHCNVTANDTVGFVGTGNNTTFIAPLYALNVTDLIDYGDVPVFGYSVNVSANVTNFGNRNINISVLGYGRTQGDGWGLVCSTGSNITVANERFATGLVNWENKTNLSSTNSVMNVTMPFLTNDTGSVIQVTWWQLYVPPNPYGICNGTVRFTASIP